MSMGFGVGIDLTDGLLPIDITITVLFGRYNISMLCHVEDKSPFWPSISVSFTIAQQLDL